MVSEIAVQSTVLFRQKIVIDEKINTGTNEKMISINYFNNHIECNVDCRLFICLVDMAS